MRQREITSQEMNVVLIGFMGSGKTTVGRELAEKLQFSFIDTDQYIEDQAGMKISDIFERQGEDAFRALENRVLEKIAGMERTVVATGGGLPLREENRVFLRKTGMVIYLKASEQTIWERLAGDHTRPLLSGENPREKIHVLQTKRAPIYQCAADRVVSVDGRKVGEIAKEIEIIIKSA